jgi:5-formyltetrahydrofolate cyclo-ligase
MVKNSLLEKNELRRWLLSDRLGMTAAARVRAEQALQEQLDAAARAQAWQRIAVFLPWRGEPDLSALWTAWAARGLRLALPCVLALDQPLRMRPWQPGEPLVADAMGLMVPSDGPDLACDVWLVPCVGIDANGARLGAGKGLYDRTINAWTGLRPLLVGICFDQARRQEAFAEPHDMRLDACLTENGWTEFRNKKI